MCDTRENERERERASINPTNSPSNASKEENTLADPIANPCNSGACPQSTTTGFRCCIDASTGGAVADNMCCPKQEVEQLHTGERVSRRRLAKVLSSDLLHIVERLER